jgi:hypothetical protein
VFDEKKDFQGKFTRLLNILISDKKKMNEFSSVSTIEQSYEVACNFVGKMDFDSYSAAMKCFSEEFRKNLAKDKRKVSEENLNKVAGGLGLDQNNSLFAPIDWIGDLGKFAMPLLQQYEAGSKIGAMLDKLF